MEFQLMLIDIFVMLHNKLFLLFNGCTKINFLLILFMLNRIDGHVAVP